MTKPEPREPYRSLSATEAGLLLHLAQPGMLGCRPTSKREEQGLDHLCELGLARRRQGGSTSVETTHTSYSVSLRGEELARYLERQALGLAR